MLNVISMEYIVALINALVDMIILVRRFHQKGHQTCYNILGMSIHWGGGGKSNYHIYGVGVCGLAGVGECGLAGVGVCGLAGVGVCGLAGVGVCGRAGWVCGRAGVCVWCVLGIECSV